MSPDPPPQRSQAHQFPESLDTKAPSSLLSIRSVLLPFCSARNLLLSMTFNLMIPHPPKLPLCALLVDLLLSSRYSLTGDCTGGSVPLPIQECCQFPRRVCPKLLEESPPLTRARVSPWSPKPSLLHLGDGPPFFPDLPGTRRSSAPTPPLDGTSNAPRLTTPIGATLERKALSLFRAGHRFLEIISGLLCLLLFSRLW